MTDNMLYIGSEEVAEYEGNASNLYKFHYLKAEKIINKKYAFEEKLKDTNYITPNSLKRQDINSFA